MKIPLDSGWLSGKYHAGSTFRGIRSRWTKEDIEIRANLVDKVKAILSSTANLAQQAIAFCLAYDAVSTVIPGNIDIAQLRHNVQSTNILFPREQAEKLEHLYESEIQPLKLPW